MMIDRRHFLGSSLALGATACIPPDQNPIARLESELRLIEAKAGGTLGAALYNTASGQMVGINADRRFGMCSTFKFSLAAMVLAQHAAGRIDAERTVRWSERELLPVSPFTTERLAEGASLRELARATQTTSDNAAANVLLRELGGPPALTAFWRSIDDPVSRLDRTEPALNTVPPTEYRDTTTPAAMSRTVARILYGDVLPEAERAELKGWAIDTATGLARVRGGLPAGWVAGDKTGTALDGAGGKAIYVDIGFAEGPKAAAPIAFATFYIAPEGHATIDPAAQAVLAKVGRIIKEFAEPERGLPLVGKLY